MAATLDNNSGNALEVARFLHAFIECSRETRESVLEMAAIIMDRDSTDDERTIAGDAIMEALCPMMAADIPEDYRKAVKDNDAAIEANIEAEEHRFADKLRVQMAAKGVTQEMLAQRAGIGQPAVSNILNRRCRPQRRTVVKFAEALGVSPDDLWTGFGATVTQG
jgi:lambda repressor-like predicted transcriptional regulator